MKRDGREKLLLDRDEVIALNEKLEAFIKLSLDSRTGLSAAEAMSAERLRGWTDGELKDIPCWKQLDCQSERCPSYGESAQRCWLRVGTLCGGTIQGDLARKLGSCYGCVVLGKVLEDPFRALGENALIIAHHLQTLTAELHSMAVRDPLTGLRNKRYLEDVIPGQIAAAKRRGSQLWLLGIDLDEFKQINDRFGHQEGDAALVEVAKLIKQSVRAGDLVFRVGGDEFLVVLLDADEPTAKRVDERLRAQLELWNRANSEARGYWLAASIGGGPIDPEIGLSRSLETVDARMYSDKQAKSPQLPS